VSLCVASSLPSTSHLIPQLLPLSCKSQDFAGEIGISIWDGKGLSIRAVGSGTARRIILFSPAKSWDLQALCADLLYSAGMIDETAIGERYRALAGELDERRRRLWAAAARATGMAENTISRGLRELETGERLEPGRVRRPGAGRTPVTTADPTLRADLERLVDTQSRGDPESPLRWTAKSVRRLRDELRTGGHRVSHETVARLLRGSCPRLDEGSYPAKVTVSDAKLEAIDLHGHAFHPEWHDTREPRGIPWRRLTLHVEAAATATACGAVANFVRHGGREVDGTPRSDVLDETSSATALGSGVDAEVQRIRGGWLGRRLCCRRVRRACDRSGAKKRTSYASLVPKPGARAGTACAREGQGNALIRRRRMGGHNGRCRHRSSDEDHEDPEG
jgi:DNA-binding transcriptional ArsR family regulator